MIATDFDGEDVGQKEERNTGKEEVKNFVNG